MTTNYQIFPGDRLIVGRNEVVKKTVEIDRLDRADPDDYGYDAARSLSCFEHFRLSTGRHATSC